MTVAEKLAVAEQLVRLRVDVIEAGFPAASPGDFTAVQEIARQVSGVSVAALARLQSHDIDLAAAALREAEVPRLHVFIATSDLHLHYKLRKSRVEVLAQVESMVRYARNLCSNVEFSAEDASRSDWDYLVTVFETAIRAGATVLNVPDTVGYAMPDEFGALIAYLFKHVNGIENVMVSAHCHNDLGMATANSLAAIRSGARQVEVTINGIGERAGNTAMEEIVMALQTRAAIFGVETRVATQQLVPASHLVSRATGLPVHRTRRS
jgi:2-isopropylmalate synthase